MTIEEWAKDFKSYVNALDMQRDDYNGIMEYIDDAIALLKEHGKPDCEHAEHDRIGCLGYAGCMQDDEPINTCKECEKYTGNIYRMVE